MTEVENIIDKEGNEEVDEEGVRYCSQQLTSKRGGTGSDRALV